MTISVVADTHAILWYLYDDSRLSDYARAIMEAVEADKKQIALASITLAEVIYLAEKGRINNSAFDRMIELLEHPASSLVEVPFDNAIAQSMRSIPRQQIPELPDRMIAATALYLKVPVISRDHKIKSSIVEAIWESEPDIDTDDSQTDPGNGAPQNGGGDS